jgi:hypothetical protein
MKKINALTSLFFIIKKLNSERKSFILFQLKILFFNFKVGIKMFFSSHWIIRYSFSKVFLKFLPKVISIAKNALQTSFFLIFIITHVPICNLLRCKFSALFETTYIEQFSIFFFFNTTVWSAIPVYNISMISGDLHTFSWVNKTNLLSLKIRVKKQTLFC